MRGWLPVLLLIVPLGSAVQLAGEAGHQGLQIAASPALDVLGPVQVWPEGTRGDLRFSPAFLPIESRLRGAVVESQGAGGCRLVELDRNGTFLRDAPVPACGGTPQPPVLAIAEPGWNLLCARNVGAGAPLALAVDDAGKDLWRLSALDLVPDTDGAWSCTSAARAGDRVIVTAGRDTPAQDTASGDHVIAAIDAGDGRVEWTSRLAAEALVTDQAGTGINNGLLGGDVAYPAFTPFTTTATDTGYVVMGDLGGARAALLLDLDGRYVQTIHSSETPLGRPAPPARGTVVDETADATLRSQLGSGWGVASGSLAYVALGPEILGLDPVAPRPVAASSPGLAYPFQPHGGLGPLLVGDRLVMPTQAGVLAVDRQSLELVWQHRMSTETGYWIWDAVATAEGDLWLAGVSNSRDERVVVQRLDARTGDLLQSLPLAMGTGMQQISFYDSLLRIVPTRDGFLVVNVIGEAMRLGPADADLVPKMAASNEYPAAGEAVRLQVGTPFGLTTQVWWGDGLSQTVGFGESTSHHYETPGDRTIRATTLLPDGNTVTSVLVVHVGGTPPPELNFLQRAFSDENRDTTWGLLGLAVAFFGGIGAYAVRVWQRRGIGKDLNRLERLRLQSADDPIGAMHGLRLFARDLRRRAAAGKLESAEFVPLSHEAQALAQAVRQRVLAHLEGRIGARLRQAVEAALADGVLTPTERNGLVAGLDGEIGLRAAERSAFRRLLSEWS